MVKIEELIGSLIGIIAFSIFLVAMWEIDVITVGTATNLVLEVFVASAYIIGIVAILDALEVIDLESINEQRSRL
ncbi:MAG: hypothetical protein ACP5U0_10125 [Caldisphaera sp.]